MNDLVRRNMLGTYIKDLVRNCNVQNIKSLKTSWQHCQVGKVSTNFAAAKKGKVGSIFSAAKNGQVSSNSKKR